MHRKALRRVRRKEMERKGGERRRLENWSVSCFWKRSRCWSSCSWSWVASMDITWFLRMLIRPRNEPWFSVAGIFG